MQKPYTVTKTKHTSTGEDIWVVSLNDKISKEEFTKLRDEVKKNGGYYSRFAKTLDGKALPGFVFKTEPGADALAAFENLSVKENNLNENKERPNYYEERSINTRIDEVENRTHGGIDGRATNDFADRRSDAVQSDIEPEVFQERSADENLGEHETVSGNKRRVETRALENIVNNQNFLEFAFTIGNELGAETLSNELLNYKTFDKNISLLQRFSYDILSGKNEKLYETFFDQIKEYFIDGKYSPDTDAFGNKVSKEYLDVLSDSKVRNRFGKLVLLYHGSDKAHEKLKAVSLGIHFGSFTQARKRVADKAIDKPVYIKAYLNVSNPFVIPHDGLWEDPGYLPELLYERGLISELKKSILKEGTPDEAFSKQREMLIKLGFDGIRYINEAEASLGEAYMVFDDSQIFRIDESDILSDKENVENEREQTGILGTESEGHPGGNVSEEAQEVEEGRDVGRNGDDGSQDSVREIHEDARLAEGEQTSSDGVQYREPDTGRDFDGELREHTDSEGRSDRTSDTSSRRLNSHNYKITEDIDSKRPNITDIDSQLNFGEDNSDVVEDMNDEFEVEDEKYYLESGDENGSEERESGRSVLLHGGYGRRNIQSAGESSEGIYGAAGTDEAGTLEKTQEERRKYAEEIMEQWERSRQQKTQK